MLIVRKMKSTTNILHFNSILWHPDALNILKIVYFYLSLLHAILLHAFVS
jgi:hypothetical protein